mmetsp:Transcript_24497/g.58222  ORF Transcript_24497/g.58222 Transcript_24497/m.58222 type:complete len:250 (-) Transcript_24497:1084-1833(-)
MFLGLHSYPVFSRGNFLDIVLQLRPCESDMILERPVHVIKFLLKLLLVLFRNISNDINSTLVLASSEQVSINLMLIKEPLEVWYLRDDSNATNDGKGCSIDGVADSCHHVPSRCGDSVHTNDKLNASLANTHQLTSSQSIRTHSAPRRSNHNDGSIDTGSTTIDNDRHLLSQDLHARKHRIPVESDKERDGAIVSSHVTDGKARLQILLNPLLQLIAFSLFFFLACLVLLQLRLSHFLHITNNVEMNLV